jgi:hypothetical protein
MYYSKANLQSTYQQEEHKHSMVRGFYQDDNKENIMPGDAQKFNNSSSFCAGLNSHRVPLMDITQFVNG